MGGHVDLKEMTSDVLFQVMERALYHADNCYNVPNFRVEGFVCKTHTPSNTAFRGFGAPQVRTALTSSEE